MPRKLGIVFAVGALVAACATAPKSEAKRSELQAEADQVVTKMLQDDPGLHSLLGSSAGYVVFPSVGQGGFIVGGASGKGVVYENGRSVGFAHLSQASIGAQIGGQKFAELIAVRDQVTLDKMKGGDFDLGGHASAVIIKQGVASATTFGDNGLAVIVQPKGGAMASVSLTGQRIKITM